MRNLNVGCGEFYVPGWVNTDFQQTDQIHPDVLVDPEHPFPFADQSFDNVYCGHVLEHVPYEGVPEFLAEIRRVLTSGGNLMVVGPDVIRVLHQWRVGEATWDLVSRCLESHPDLSNPDRHHWNCSGERVVGMLEVAGFDNVTEYDMLKYEPGGSWPVVEYNGWQFAAGGTNP